ncbi:HemK/PrmC family methyltransferase [Uliginosibacterium sediminicola]|uniref:Release factor glutamine methyltransferase n=1 Tax=Uliginosibacterium sediminicola TaxID=2024550 RepID=A0ABU9YXH3_9RHOO
MSLPATLGEALAWARARIDAVDAKVLLREASGASAAALVAFAERALPAEAAARFVDWVTRREAGEPVAHILGCREFYGQLLRVTPDTLIPRPETELLVELALSMIAPLPLSRPDGHPLPQGEGTADAGPARSSSLPPGGGWPEAGRGAGAKAARVLDLGTGSGAIAIAIALASEAQVSAIDASAAALSVAQDNAQRLSAPVRYLHGSWFAPVAGERFDLIVTNPPYIAEGDAHLAQGDVRFEPRSALTSGADGLDDIRLIITQAPLHLNAGGLLLIEHGYDQAAAVRDLLGAAGFGQVQSWRDLAGIERVSGGCL